MRRTEEDTEICFLPHLVLKTIFPELSSINKPPNKPPMKVSTLPNTSSLKESFQESKLIKDLPQSPTEKDKTTPRDLMHFQQWPQNSTNLDADSLNGELS